jgi:hypothetical protein
MMTNLIEEFVEFGVAGLSVRRESLPLPPIPSAVAR